MSRNHVILDSGIEEIEKVSNSGGFYYKEWQKSKSNSKDPDGIMLANSPFDDEEEEASGLMWNSTNDTLYV